MPLRRSESDLLKRGRRRDDSEEGIVNSALAGRLALGGSE